MKKALINNPIKALVIDDILKSSIIIIRHAESEFNKTVKLLKERIEIVDQKIFLKNIKSDRQLVDSFITEKGRNQCLKAGKELSNIPIKYIFTSPLRRSLETCKLVIQSKFSENSNYLIPIKEIKEQNNIKIIVHPYLFEKIEDSCDLIEDINKNRDNYKEFDWSFFDNMNRNDFLFYQANFCDNYHHPEDSNISYSEEIRKYIKEKNLKENKEIIDIYLDVVLKGISKQFDNGKFIESSFKTIERLDYFKNFIMDFIEKNKINNENNNEKILVFGHSIYFKHLTSKKLSEEDLSPPLEDSVLENCEFIGIKFDI